MMGPGSRDTSEGDGIVCCRLELEEEGRSNSEKKTHLQNFIDPASDAVEKTTSDKGDMACRGRH